MGSGRTPTKVTYPSGKVLTSSFDDAGNRTALTYPDATTATFDYDGNNRLSSLSHPTVGSITYGYDLDDRLTAETIPGGTSRSYSFTDGRMVSYSETIGAATRTTSLAFDSADRLVSETTAGTTTSYDYDTAGQLIEVVRGSGATSYGYDQVGNRTSKTQGSVSTSYSYDAAQQVTSAARTVSGLADQQVAFTHDGAGRLTLAESLGSSFAMGYDARGLPTQITHSDVAKGTFGTQRRYDADGRLASAEVTGPLGTVRLSSFAWDQVSQISEIATTSSGATDTNFLLGVGREVAIRSGGFDAFSYDGYGSALSTTDTEDLVRASGYDEFGVPNSPEPLPTLLEEVMSLVGDSSRNHTPLFGYRGEMHLNGLIHLRAREYGVGLGRFTTKDPIAPGQVMFANPYPYSSNDPLGLIDPLGLTPIGDCDLRPGCSSVEPIPSPAGDPLAPPSWLSSKARKLANEIIRGTILARTTGLCLDGTLDTRWFSAEVQGCVVDDADKLGGAFFAAAGLGVTLGGDYAAGASAGWLLSNAKQIENLRGPTLCAGVSIPVRPPFGAGVELCFSLYSDVSLSSLKEGEFEKVFTGVFSLNAGASYTRGALVSGRAILGRTSVGVWWDYPWWLGQLCGGRIIRNPLTISASQSPICAR